MLISVVSAETGEIFAEGLCGLGSARRWVTDHGLTEDYLEDDEEYAKSVAGHELYMFEMEVMLAGPNAADARKRLDAAIAEGPTRFLYVKDYRVCLDLSPIRSWSPPIRDVNGTVVDDGFWFIEGLVPTTAFKD